MARGRNQDRLDDILTGWTRTRTVAEIEELMNANSIPAGRIYRAPEMLANPHFAARGSIIEVETERYGALKMQAPFPVLSDTPSRVRSAAPVRVGEHNAQVYGEMLGMSAKELGDLAARGVN